MSAQTGRHVGAIGETLRFAATLVSIIKLPPHIQWGQRYLYNLTDADGSQFIWVTKTSPEQTGREPGSIVKVKGTVKRHGAYSCVKQTELSRVAMETP